MPKGICGSSTEETTALDMGEDEERAHLTLWWQWDGTSTWPNCHGILTRLEIRNNHDEAWEAVFKSEDTDPIVFPMSPHVEATIDQVVLGSRGLTDLADMGGVLLRPASS